jgi:hypothetical protein
MKRLACFFLLCAVTAASGRADDALVAASKEAKAKRKKSTTKVITNADVRKSKGALVETGAAETSVPAPGPTPLQQHEAARQASALLASRTAQLERQIALLGEELAAIEQSYYDESDLARRDGEIVRRFEDAKRRLDEANARLETMRRGAAAPEATAEGNPPEGGGTRKEKP